MIKRKAILICAVAVAAFGLLWEAMYPDSYDPKNLHYVAWKHHLLPMDPNRALSTMTHDSYSERLVVGSTEEQLRQRFGFVRTVDQVSPYLQNYCAAVRPGAHVLFLNSSDYMVVMNQERATELILCKG
jgi:hypothetical protein